MKTISTLTWISLSVFVVLGTSCKKEDLAQHEGPIPPASVNERQPVLSGRSALLCEPDPVASYCSEYRGALRAESQTNHYESLAKRFRGIERYVDRGYKYEHEHPGKGFARSRDEIFAEFEAQYGRPQVIANVRNALRIVKSVIEKRVDFLDGAGKGMLTAFVDTCAENVGLMSIAQLATSNASISFSSKAYLYSLATGEKAPFCSLSLAGVTYIACSEGDPSCYSTLFHEFGHLMDPCMPHRVAFFGDLWVQKTAEGYAEESFLKKKWDGLLGRTREQVEMIEKASPRFPELYRSSYGLWKPIRQLEAISAPKHAVEDSCRDPELKDLNPAIRGDCGYAEAEGYPSQWSEAGADFWGATFFAAWSEEHSNPTQLVQDAVESMCEADFHGGRFQSSDDLKKIFRGMGLSDEVIRLLTHNTGERKCEKLPLDAAEAPWGDSHQNWLTRLNRNFLRNSDLRKVLGCAPQSSIEEGSPLSH